MARTVSVTSACGVATLSSPLSAVMVVLLAVMPSGWKMRCRMKSSHDMFVVFATTCPAARYMMFW